MFFGNDLGFPLEAQANGKFELTIGRFADGHLHLFGQILLLMNISCKLNSKCNFTYNETTEFQEMHGNRLRCCTISTFYRTFYFEMQRNFYAFAEIGGRLTGITAVKCILLFIYRKSFMANVINTVVENPFDNKKKCSRKFFKCCKFFFNAHHINIWFEIYQIYAHPKCIHLEIDRKYEI